ncbi:CLUMA_CG003745, isoform A [Clunio marinus]|uniref:CLUMA_CG003745, isoform A n=1 Tax=Clunio marinus TaxID=568069 RepID=A0A1J1HRJ9_9DIPT|nr:CLUMA_CG003745, isoform A [Clunio marinus]
MKIFGIDDNSEAFSLLITAVIGILLFIFTYRLHENVMSKKTSNIGKEMNGKLHHNGITKETEKDLTKTN